MLTYPDFSKQKFPKQIICGIHMHTVHVFTAEPHTDYKVFNRESLKCSSETNFFLMAGT